MKFFEIDFLEAGTKDSGDAISLRYRTDENLDYIHVVDGGYKDDGPKLVKHIRDYYDSLPMIDHVVLTHPDGDHAAGLKAVLQEVSVQVLWMNRPWMHLQDLMSGFKYEYTEEGLRRRLKRDFPHTAELEKIANEQSIEIRDAFQGATIGAFKVLAPSRDRYLDLIVESEKTPEEKRAATVTGRLYERAAAVFRMVAAVWGQENLKGDSEGTSSENETSVVQFAELCGRKILLTGDAGVGTLSEAYQYALSLGVDLPGIDWFDVPHHGSRRNLSSSVLDQWLGERLFSQIDTPSFTAIVSANHNDKDHPRNAVVRALVHRGGRVVVPRDTLQLFRNTPDRGEGWQVVKPLEYPTDMEE